MTGTEESPDTPASYGIVYPRVLYHGLPKPRWLVADFHVVPADGFWVLRAWSHEGRDWLLRELPATARADGLFAACPAGLLAPILAALDSARLRYEIVANFHSTDRNVARAPVATNSLRAVPNALRHAEGAHGQGASAVREHRPEQPDTEGTARSWTKILVGARAIMRRLGTLRRRWTER